MTVDKQPICPHMIRRIPEQFSWIDHRLVRERYIDHLSHQASALYLFLVTVGDNQGLSYYSDQTLCKRLDMDMADLENGRNSLVQHRLVAYSKPLYQVLALDQQKEPVRTGSEVASIGQILHQLMRGTP